MRRIFSCVYSTGKSDFGLRHSLFGQSGGKQSKRRIAPKALLRFRRKVRELTGRNRGISVEQMTKELAIVPPARPRAGGGLGAKSVPAIYSRLQPTAANYIYQSLYRDRSVSLRHWPQACNNHTEGGKKAVPVS